MRNLNECVGSRRPEMYFRNTVLSGCRGECLRRRKSCHIEPFLSWAAGNCQVIVFRSGRRAPFYSTARYTFADISDTTIPLESIILTLFVFLPINFYIHSNNSFLVSS